MIRLIIHASNMYMLWQLLKHVEKKHVNIQFSTNLSVKCYRQSEMKNDFPEIKSMIKSYSITFLLWLQRPIFLCDTISTHMTLKSC